MHRQLLHSKRLAMHPQHSLCRRIRPVLASPSSMIRNSLLNPKMTAAAQSVRRVDCGCLALSRTMVLSSSERLCLPGECRRCDEGFHFCEILAAPVRPAGVDSKTKTDRPDGGSKDLAKVEAFVAAATFTK